MSINIYININKMFWGLMTCVIIVIIITSLILRICDEEE